MSKIFVLLHTGIILKEFLFQSLFNSMNIVFCYTSNKELEAINYIFELQNHIFVGPVPPLN
jgi:DUF1365 family protein